MARDKVKPPATKVAARKHTEADVVKSLKILALGHPLKMREGRWYLCGGQIPDGLAQALRSRAGLRSNGNGEYLPAGSPP